MALPRMLLKKESLKDAFFSSQALPVGDNNPSFFQQAVINQSPIMKIWGILMIVNLLAFLFLLQ